MTMAVVVAAAATTAAVSMPAATEVAVVVAAAAAVRGRTGKVLKAVVARMGSTRTCMRARAHEFASVCARVCAREHTALCVCVCDRAHGSAWWCVSERVREHARQRWRAPVSATKHSSLCAHSQSRTDV